MIFNVRKEPARTRAQVVRLRMMSVLERGFRARIKAILKLQYSTVAEHLEYHIVDVEHVLNHMRGYMIKEISEQYTRIGVNFFRMVERDFNKLSVKKGIEPKNKKGYMEDEYWRTYHQWTLRQSASKVTMINETTRRHLRKVINDAGDDGLSNIETAKEIRKVAPSISAKRAMRIARTETHTAANMSTHAAVKATKLQPVKEWCATFDGRTRADHAAADGQRVAEDAAFEVGGEYLQYPGDPAGSAENVCQCRCVLIYDTEELLSENGGNEEVPIDDEEDWGD